MTSTLKIIQQENVNGVNLSLKVESRCTSPNSQRFTISYKNEEKRSKWPLKSLFLALMFNILALFYVRISVQAMIIIIIVLSFLIFFWITHSVQSGMVYFFMNSFSVFGFYIIIIIGKYVCNFRKCSSHTDSGSTEFSEICFW